jgi:hypothetical protein
VVVVELEDSLDESDGILDLGLEPDLQKLLDPDLEQPELEPEQLHERELDERDKILDPDQQRLKVRTLFYYRIKWRQIFVEYKYVLPFKEMAKERIKTTERIPMLIYMFQQLLGSVQVLDDY